MNFNQDKIFNLIKPKVRNNQLTYDDFEKIFSFLNKHEKKYVEKIIEHKLKIFLVYEIENGLAEEEKKFVDFVLQKIQPEVENNQLTYDEFDELFAELEKKKQYHVVNILAELNIELVDEKILPTKVEKIKQPLIFRKAEDIKLSNNMLVSLIQKGDKQAVQDLCVKNYGLVKQYAKKYFGKSQTLTEEELIQEGMLGMLKAAEKFNFDKGTQFSTYATWWIFQSISRAIMDTGTIVRLPVHIYETILKARRISNYFYLQGKDFSERVELVSEEMELSVAMVKYLFQLYDNFITCKSLDEPVGEEKDTPRIDFLPDDKNIFEKPEDATISILLKEQISEVLSTLTPREQKVLKLRFGLEDGKDRTLEEVGTFFNVTRERIRQIELKALKKLRHRSRSEKLKVFLN